jgi:hypothetical protein
MTKIVERLRIISILSLIFMIICSSFSLKTCGVVGKFDYSLSESKNDLRSYPLYKVSQSSPPSTESENILDLNNLLSCPPRVFTENLGQLDNNDVLFYDPGSAVWFTADEVWFELREYAEASSQLSAPRSQGGVGVTPQTLNSQTHTPTNSETHTQKYKRVILKQEFVGANDVIPIGIKRAPWCSNYFYGNDSTKWQTNVQNYEEIIYKNLYDGIDLRYYDNEIGLKYDFIVHPGAKPEHIRIKINGANGLIIDPSGDLRIRTQVKDVLDRDLKIYQTSDGVNQVIHGRFKLHNNYEYGFEILDNYDNTESLIIDPILEFSTFIGGGSTEYCKGISVDKSGNSIITGFTYSSTFPTTNGSYSTVKNKKYDCYVLKLSNNGSSLIYSTFIGGNDSDYASDVELDSQGIAYITGTTSSPDFPTTPNSYNNTHSGYEDVFVLKLNSTGSGLIYSTLVGGSKKDQSWDLDIDSSGSVFVTGDTSSSDFPVITGSYDTSKSIAKDIFVFKLNQTGQKLVYSTFIGGNDLDMAYGIAVDKFSNAYITGETSSPDFPKTSGAFDMLHNGTIDAFVCKLNKTGKGLVYSTFIGGDQSDYGRAITIKSNDCVIITGDTGSTDFPITLTANDTSYNGLGDCFVLILNQTGQSLVSSTFIGGNSIDYGYGLCLDDAENIHITGQTVSSDFPISANAYNDILNSYDIFLTKLTPDLSSIVYSTFIGGSLSDKGTGISLDSFGGVYVIGETSSSSFPTTEGSYDTRYAGNWDGVVFKFSFQPSLGIMSVSLLKDEIPAHSIYPKIGPYNVRINFIHSANVTDLGNVRLILDPGGNDLQINWDYSTGLFTKINDPNNYINLEPSSYYIDINNIFWTLNVHLTFNWHYPDENEHNIQTYATSTSLPKAWLNISNFYSVENDLDFFGNLSVVDENNVTIYEDDLVPGGVMLNWTGLTPVFENTENVHPPNDEFDIVLSDGLGNEWLSSPETGGQIHFLTKTPNFSIINGLNYSISFVNLPTGHYVSNKTFRIRIDADNVSFSNPQPRNNSWQTSTEIEIGIEMIDRGGGLVDGGTVSYSISKDNGSSWEAWEIVADLTSDHTLNPVVNLSFEEGINNLIQWRAEDNVGNGPNRSSIYRILIDTQEIKYSNPWLSYDLVSENVTVQFGITITDNTSGVNSSKIQYSISNDNGVSWGDWFTVENVELLDGLEVVVKTNHTFKNGTENLIKWRAWDVAGNGPMKSDSYVVNLKSDQPFKKPQVILLSPSSGINSNSSEITLEWQLQGSAVQGVVYDLYFSRQFPPTLFIENLLEFKYSIKNLEDGETYYWQVIPKYGNIEGTCISGIWWFKVDLESIEPGIPKHEFNITIEGPNNITLYQDEKKNIELLIINNGKFDLNLKLNLEAGEMLRYLMLDNDSLMNLEVKSWIVRNLELDLPKTAKPGFYKIGVRLIATEYDNKEIARHEIIVEVKEKLEVIDNETIPPDDDNKNNDTKDESGLTVGDLILFTSIAIILVIILILIIFGLLRRRNKMIEGKLQHLGGYTIKPRAKQVQVVQFDKGASTVISQQTQQPTPTSTPSPLLTQLPAQQTQSTQPDVSEKPTITIPIPQVAQPQVPISQPDEKLQMPQVIQKPQLPPAKADDEAEADEENKKEDK